MHHYQLAAHLIASCACEEALTKAPFPFLPTLQEFDTDADAQNAINGLDGQMHAGSKLRVEVAKQREGGPRKGPPGGASRGAGSYPDRPRDDRGSDRRPDDRGYDRRPDDRGYERRDERPRYDDRRPDDRGYDRRPDDRGYERRDERPRYDDRPVERVAERPRYEDDRDAHPRSRSRDRYAAAPAAADRDAPRRSHDDRARVPEDREEYGGRR